MLLHIIDTTGAKPGTIASVRIVSTTSRALFYCAETISDAAADVLRAVLAEHGVRFVQTGREFIVDLDSTDYDFRTIAA